MGKDLDISTSVAFVKDRIDSTIAVQLQIADLWIWGGKTLAEWDAHAEQLNSAIADTLAGNQATDTAAYQAARGALATRLQTIKEWLTQANEIMRVRAKQDPSLAQAVRPLKSGSKSWSGIERQGKATLATWTTVFTSSFTPGPGKTLAGFQALFDGDDSDSENIIPSLEDLKKAQKNAQKKARLSTGKLNRLISQLEDDCMNWYAEATAVFRKNTAEGATIRDTVPTSDDYNPPTGAPTPISIQAISVTGPASVMITYASGGGAGVTSRKLQWRFSSESTWADYGTIVRPNQLATRPEWEQASLVFRVVVANSHSAVDGPEAAVSL